MTIPQYRTLFNAPLHDETVRFYPKPLAPDQFIAEMRTMVQHFEEGLKHEAGMADPYKRLAPKHIEAWVEHFLRMSEVWQHVPPKPKPIEKARDASFEEVVRSMV